MPGLKLARLPTTTDSGTPEICFHLLAAYRSGKSQIPMLRFDEITVHIYGDTAVVRGILTVDRSDNGVHLSRSSRYTRVYVRFPEGWRAVVGHSSQLCRETNHNCR